MKPQALEDFRTKQARGVPHAAILMTALPLEAWAVLPHLIDVCTVKGDKGTLYYCGRFPCASGDWFVAVAVTLAGNHGAATIVQSALTDFRDIDLVLFVGIAGSLKDDIAIGSVVASSQVYEIHSGKADAKMLARPRMVTPPHGLVQAALHVTIQNTWHSRIRAPQGTSLPLPSDYPCNFPPAAHVAPIASGEQVVVSKKSATYRLIKLHLNDACAIEMEGFGTLYAASHFENVPGLVIRGISDGLSDKTSASDAVNQPLAAAHAAAFAFELLSTIAVFDGPLGPGDGPSNSPVGLGSELADEGAPPPPEDNSADSPKGNLTGNSASSQNRLEFVISLDGTTDELDETQINSIIESLRIALDDPSVRLVRVESGSIRLVVNIAAGREARLRDPETFRRVAAEQNVTIRNVGSAQALSAAKDLEQSFRMASAELLHWPQRLPGGEWLERPELNQIATRIASKEPTATIVLGTPGAGKSALLAALAEQHLEAGAAVLAIKADSLPTSVETDLSLQQCLGLQVDTRYAIDQVSRWKPVVLIIDQLDALAYYVDLKTGRLNLLLNLIRRVSGLPNVHVVASCRAFEFDHDARLHAIDAESILLELPPWHEVAAVLREHGVDTEGWPSDAREVLRIPQALKTFLELRPRGSEQKEVFSSYRAMLDALWNERVLNRANGPKVASLAAEIATTMANEEALWLAEARFEPEAGDLRQLESSGILVRSNQGGQIGFSHQTVFEHALARAFTRLQGGLSQYVLNRQDSLFVRPKLWFGLGYLRDVETHTYEQELQRIWSYPTLRTHVRHLLIEFLGQQAEPTDFEEVLLTSAIRGTEYQLTSSVLTAIVGSPGWFARFKASFLPKFMASSEWPNHIITILRMAWRFAPEEVFRLIHAHWFSEAKQDALVWFTLEDCTYWVPKVVQLATAVLRRTDVAPMRVNFVISTLAVEDPEAAIALVRASLDRALQAVEGEVVESGNPPFPREGSLDEQITWQVKFEPTKPYQKLLEGRGDWFDLPELAAAAPTVFMHGLWEWYSDVFRAVARRGRLYGVGFDADLLMFDFMEGDERDVSRGAEPPLLTAIVAAVTTLAQTEPDSFLEWVSRTEDSDLLVVQRLIAIGYLAVPERYAAQAARFLLADKRRLILGDYRDRFAITKALIQQIAPYLTTELKALEQAVLSYKDDIETADATPEDRRRRFRAIRAERLRLLRAFPRESLSKRAQRLIPEEERALGSPPDWDMRSVGGGLIGSPMSAQAMERADDVAVLGMLQEIDDSTGWDHPRDWLRGGSIQLSREFGEFARKLPRRAAGIVRQLKPGSQERPAAHAIEAIARSAGDTNLGQMERATLSELALALLRELNAKGFGKVEFRETTASAVGKLIEAKASVPDDVLEILSSWLASAPEIDAGNAIDAASAAEVDADSVTKSSADERNHGVVSRLWGHGHISLLPNGNYPILEAILRVLLSRNPPAVDRLVQLLSDHLRRIESPDVWRALLMNLQYLAWGNRAAGEKFLIELFDRYPTLVETHEAAILIAHVQSWVSDDVLRGWLGRLEACAKPSVAQAYGELIGLIAIVRQDPGGFFDIACDIARGAETSSVVTMHRVGLGFAAANLWGETRFRHRAAKFLVMLLPNAGALTAEAILDVFRINERLVPDGPTVQLLEGLLEHPQVMRDNQSYFLVECLESLLPHEAALVGRLAHLLVDEWKENLADIRSAGAAVAPQLVDLSLTLHRLGPPVREAGLVVFEELLKIQAQSARETLDQLDQRLPIRPAAVSRPKLPRRGRRRGRSKAS